MAVSSRSAALCCRRGSGGRCFAPRCR